jgi:hypothetical protein
MPATLAAAHSFVSCTGQQFCVFSWDGWLSDWHDPASDDDNWPCCGHHGVQNDDNSFQNDATVAVVVYDGSNQSGTAKYCARSNMDVYDIPDAIGDDGNSSDHRSSTSCPPGVVSLP